MFFKAGNTSTLPITIIKVHLFNSRIFKTILQITAIYKKYNSLRKFILLLEYF